MYYCTRKIIQRALRIDEKEAAMGKGKKILKGLWKWIRRHKKLIIFLVIVIVLVIVIRNYVIQQAERVTALMNQVQQTATVDRRDIVSYISTTGVVESEENQRITSTLTGDEVGSVLVEVGDEVKPGDSILIFDTEDLEEDIANVNLDIENSRRQTSIALGQAERQYNNALEAEEEDAATIGRSLADAKKDYEDARQHVQELEVRLNADLTYLTSKQAELDALQEEYTAAQMEYDWRNKDLSDKESYLNIASVNLRIAQAELSEYMLDYPEEFTSVGGSLVLNNEVASEEASDLQENVNRAQSDVNSYTIQYQDAQKVLLEIQPDYMDISNTYATLQTAYQEALQAWQTTNTALMNMRATLDSAEMIYQNALTNESSSTRMGETSVSNSRDSLDNQRITASTSTRALEEALETYQENLEKAVVKTPIKGIVTQVGVKEGDIYGGGTLVTVQDCDTYIVVVQIDEYDISNIQEGMKVLFKTDATRDDELEGEITFVAPTPTTATMADGTAVISSGSASYRVEVSVKSQDDRLRLGMTAKTNIVMKEIQQVLAVPFEAIQTDPDGNSYVAVQEMDELGNPAERNVNITIGTEGDYYVEVICEEEDLEGKTVVIPDAAGNPLEDLMNSLTISSDY
jgi:RND family efflux transporter MFP subunit